MYKCVVNYIASADFCELDCIEVSCYKYELLYTLLSSLTPPSRSNNHNHAYTSSDTTISNYQPYWLYL